MSLSIEQLDRFVAELAGAPDRWAHWVRHTDDRRVHEQICEDEHVNAWIICWSKDQDTGFHDHDESAAAVAVISGHVREERLRVGAAPTGHTLGPGSTFTVPPVAIHRVLHAGDQPAVTIHAYSPPLTRTGAYRIGPDGELERASLRSEHELRPEPALSAF